MVRYYQCEGCKAEEFYRKVVEDCQVLECLSKVMTAKGEEIEEGLRALKDTEMGESRTSSVAKER